jgi:hypothetical protein
MDKNDNTSNKTYVYKYLEPKSNKMVFIAITIR